MADVPQKEGERPGSAKRWTPASGPLVPEISSGSIRANNPRVLVVPAFREASYQEKKGWEAAWQTVKKACEDVLGSLGEAVQVSHGLIVLPSRRVPVLPHNESFTSINLRVRTAVVTPW
jgi:hypothetical protein